MRLFSPERSNRVRYFWWAAKQVVGSDTTCPSCGNAGTRLVRRKYLVTSLYECPDCALRFRVPRETSGKVQDLYVEESYRQGFTTALPSPEELAALLSRNFSGHGNHYGRFIAAIQALDLPRDARVVDFGSSWGYGSWQLRQAGFSAFSYEIGRDRAQFARDRLGCTMVDDLRTLDGTIDCFFSAHVIEHLPDPNIIFAEAAKLLVPGGSLICFCPNGSPTREKLDANYDRYWGQVHPLLITPEFMKWACKRHGFELVKIGRGGNDIELLTVARKPAS
jgi:predicted RNA-binding Zn-ribbon protein involved in translation (DUF1610 family)